MVKIAQQKRTDELAELAKQPDLFQFNFSKSSRPSLIQEDVTVDHHHDEIPQNATHDNSIQNKVQQDLR